MSSLTSASSSDTNTIGVCVCMYNASGGWYSTSETKPETSLQWDDKWAEPWKSCPGCLVTSSDSSLPQSSVIRLEERDVEERYCLCLHFFVRSMLAAWALTPTECWCDLTGTELLMLSPVDYLVEVYRALWSPTSLWCFSCSSCCLSNWPINNLQKKSVSGKRNLFFFFTCTFTWISINLLSNETYRWLWASIGEEIENRW